MLPVKLSLKPMEAKSVEEIPRSEEWQYEPKWDGFRCIVFRDGDKIQLQSKSGRPLGRYFPDVVEALRQLGAKKFVLDSEIVIPVRARLSFDQLLMRIHPAESRVRKLAEEHPAMLVLFDLLADSRGKSFLQLPLSERRPALERFAERYSAEHESIRLSPATTDPKLAAKWLRSAGTNLDGVIAKRTGLPYRAGLRDGMQKIKRLRTADCVVGGFRYSRVKKTIGSLLLGLYDDDGLLHHVGFTSSFDKAMRVELTAVVEPLRSTPGFTGRAPGGPSRWSTAESTQWEPLRTKLVAEVVYDQFSGDRFRHGTKFLRWRPDKSPRSCTFTQVKQRTGASLKLLT
jgi:ATP-dependent DNA ligase